MTTKMDIRRVVDRYGDIPRDELPLWLLQPQSAHQLNMAVGLLSATWFPMIEPVYRRGCLVAWRGITEPR